MNASIVTVPMKSIAANIEARIVVKGQRTFSARVWAAIQLLKLAARVMPVKTEIVMERIDV